MGVGDWDGTVGVADVAGAGDRNGAGGWDHNGGSVDGSRDDSWGRGGNNSWGGGGNSWGSIDNWDAGGGGVDSARAVGLVRSARSDGNDLGLVDNTGWDGHGNTEDGGGNGNSGETHFD